MSNMNSNAHTHIDELIITYLSEGLDDSSLAELKSWVGESQQNKDEFLRRQEIWFSSRIAADDNEYDVEHAKEIFRKRVHRAKADAQINRKPNKAIYSKLWKYAVAAVVACIIAFMAYWRGGEDIKSNFADITVEAPLGAKTKLYLPDGTLVWLNAGTKLSYSQGFGVEDRFVNISGEGYFEVARNERLPFSVRSGTLNVRVLGTKFNFRDYNEDSQASVSLLEGKVALSNLIIKSNDIVMSPNQQAFLDKKSGTLTMKSSIASNSASWKEDAIFFDEETLPEIIKILERSYKVKIVLKNDSLKDLRFYGNFASTDQSIEEVLHALSSTGKFKYEIENETAFIY